MLEMGKIEKSWIESYTDNPTDTSAPRNIDGNTRYVLAINPETISRKYLIEYNTDNNTTGTSQVQKYKQTKPEELKLDVIIDGTGVVKDAGLIGAAIVNPFEDSKNDVTSRIDLLKKFCYDYNGDIHRPCYIKFCWGNIIFKGVLTSLDIDYKLFRPDGKPIRAIVHIGLISSMSSEEATRLEDKQSPDITHQRVFKGSDHFTLMTNAIYDDPGYYTDVAKANKMPGFRKIETGVKINFPPLK